MPGAARTNEIWLDVPSGAVDAAEADARAAAVSVASRRSPGAALLDEARDDPLGHGTLLALVAAAVVALLLAAFGLALTVLSDLRDDRGDLYDLESQGAQPSLLRRIVRVRALVVGLAGVVAGCGRRGAPRAPRHPGRLRHGARRGTRPCRSPTVVRPARRRGRRGVAYLLLAAALVVLATQARVRRDDRGPVRAQEAEA